MKSYIRRPQWEVTIKRPDYTKSKLDYKDVAEWSRNGKKISKIRFVSSADRSNGINIFTDMIGYEYEEQLSNPENPFSLNFVPRLDDNGLSWKDKIRAKDMIFISEFGLVRYVGIVKGSGYSMSMNNGKPQRQISITGSSIGGLLQSYNLPMNTYLWLGNGTDNETENDKLADAMAQSVSENQKLTGIFKLINEAFLSVNFGSSGSPIGFKAVLDKFFDLEADNLVSYYPMLLRPYQQDSNTLWSIYKQILPSPVYEIFGTYKNGKYNVICREAPFDYDDWTNLPETEINPLYLISQDLNDSDSEVYTHYYSNMPNSAYSGLEVYAAQELDEVSIFDKEKLPIYGYNQLTATFPFFDLSIGDNSTAKEYLKKNSRRLYSWYVNNVDFQSGSITLHTVPGENNKYISIGEKITYMEGSNNKIQFYVEGTKRKMTYGDKMTSTYSVTRGYEYGDKTIKVDGKNIRTPQVKRISQLGRKIIQTEKDTFQQAGK